MPVPVRPKSTPTEEITVSQEDIVPGSGFQLIPPTWAFRFSFTPVALGHTDVSGGQGLTSKGFSLGFEYQPKFLQHYGMLGFGPSLDVYPILPANPQIQSSPYTIWSFGGTIRYQARYFREQWLVPELAYDIERLNVATLTGNAGHMILSGPEGGVYFLLNPLEPSSAFQFYKDVGVLRTYLTAEVRDLNGSNTAMAVSGVSYYVGIRTEF